MDCFEKRNKKGYLFLIGDEKPYDVVSKHLVKSVIGDSLQEDIETSDLVKELQKTFHVYYIMPNMTSHYKEEGVVNSWKKLLGQNVLMLDDASGICELIASTVGLMEGSIDDKDIEKDLKEAGVSAVTAKAVHSALVPGSSAAPGKGKALSVPMSSKPSGLAKV